MIMMSYLSVFYTHRGLVYKKFSLLNTFNTNYLMMWILLLKYALGSLRNKLESYNIRVEEV